MGVPVLVIGESGSGKTRSLKNFTKDELGIITVAGKPLPFKSDIKSINVNKLSLQKRMDRYALIKHVIKGNCEKVKSFAIDDTQYLMAFESFDKANEKGFDKFTNMAVSFQKLIRFVTDELPDDVIVYFLHHSEVTEIGRHKAKTIGKMLDNQLTIEGLFTIVLLCECNENKHYFITQSQGISTAKSPEDMLPLEMENDLKVVDQAIREYWNLGGESDAN